MTPSELDAVARAVADLNPTLRVHKTVRGNVPLKELFDLRAFTSPAVAALEPSCGCDGSHEGHDHAHAHAQGPNAVATVAIPLPPLTVPQFDRLNTLLESLLWKRAWPAPDTASAPDILRTKGYVVLQDGSARLIQGVSDLFEIRELQDTGEVRPKVVFIGRGVDDSLIEKVQRFVGVQA